ncbi:MAG: cryptochrome/photolyase family protein [Bacteriovoracia bacterium]
MSSLCWLRRDLRLHDHAALSASLAEGETTLVFIFDTQILGHLTDKSDRRITFIIQSLMEMEKEVHKYGSSIIIRYGDPIHEIPKLARELKVKKVHCNRDYEPYAKKRDNEIEEILTTQGIGFYHYKDQVIFEKHETQKNQGGIYQVFTPYKNKWLKVFEESGKNVSDYECRLKNLRKFTNKKNILEKDWYRETGFVKNPPLLEGGTKAARERLKIFETKIKEYDHDRDFPAIQGTSLLSVYIRFGNISIRDMLRAGSSHKNEGAKTWIIELIWRDFYQMILDAYPEVEKVAFNPAYRKINWRGNEKNFIAWCEGRTGYPLIDAAMRCLNDTGLMHNRLRMIVASFLTKTLLINWQKGERYFASALLDYDLAANNGGWQWAASTGCDAQPYFRIFNPYSQSKKFDPEGKFIRKWVPELAHLSNKEIHEPNSSIAPDYPKPIVNYQLNRERALLMYSSSKTFLHKAK